MHIKGTSKKFTNHNRQFIEAPLIISTSANDEVLTGSKCFMFVVEYISQLIGQASRIADYFINVIMRMSENPKIDVALLDKILQLHN